MNEDQRERKRAYIRDWNQRKLRLYRLTADQYELLLDRGCGICGAKPDAGFNVRFHVDHDHRRGRTRGVLCQSCNLALGHLHDDPDLAMSMARYLIRSVECPNSG